MRDSDHDLWCKAVQGDAAPLLENLPEGAVAGVARPLNSVFVVEPGPDGRQTGTVALARTANRPVFGVQDIPGSFRVQRIDHDDRHWILHAADGRTLKATPGQFANQPPILDEQNNPCYQAQLEQSWEAIARMYANDAPDRPVPEISDEVLGGFEFDEDLYEYSATFEPPSDQVYVRFGAAEPERIKAMLPSVRTLLDDFERIRQSGLRYLWDRWLRYLWDRGPDDQTSEQAEAEFFREAIAFRLEFYYSGDFILNYSDGGAGYFADGYWMAVHFRGEDATPVMLSMEG